MQTVYAQILVHYRTLGINTASYDEQITDALMASLPEKITTSWQRDWGYNVQPNLEQALVALQKEVRMKHSDELRRASSRPKLRDLSINAINSKRARSRTPTPGPKECIFCDNKTHPSFKCTESTIEKRKEILAQQKRCFRCLREGHRVAECTANIQCHLCNSKNHRLVIWIKKLASRSIARSRKAIPTGEDQPIDPITVVEKDQSQTARQVTNWPKRQTKT
jgi:hypothetical protein